MASRNGSIAPERAAGGQALIISDMISCSGFPDAEKLLPGAIAIAQAIARSRERCRRPAAGVLTIYANDSSAAGDLISRHWSNRP